MAFKFILGHHIKAILNDVEEKQKKDIKDYTRGHLNESVLLRAPLALNRKSWASAQIESVHETKQVRPLSKPRVLKKKSSEKEALYDFALGASGVIPRVQCNASKAPEIRYRIVTEVEKEAERNVHLPLRTPMSLYSELEDRVLVEELQPCDLIISDHHVNHKTAQTIGSDDKISSAGDSTIISQTSFLSKRSQLESPDMYKYLVLPAYNQGITKKEQYRKKTAFDLALLQKQETYEKLKILSGERTARHHEQKLQQELDRINLDGSGSSLHHLQTCSNILNDITQESPSLGYILHCIKTEYDTYISKLLDGQPTQEHYLHSQVNQMISLGTSRPNEMIAATEKLKALEKEAKYLLDMNQKLHIDVKLDQEQLNETPEIQAVKKDVTVGGVVKEQHIELSVELENMKALILEKLDELNSLRMQTRADFVPITVCSHLEQCIKETEVEVQKLLKQNEYFERSIDEMESDLKEAIIEADTSEKDARRIWRKVNSTRGMPGVRQATGAESDEDHDDASKWDWYIS